LNNLDTNVDTLLIFIYNGDSEFNQNQESYYMAKKIMKANEKRVFVEALRSGSFVQGSGSLRTHFGEAYCCLGVAKKVLGGRCDVGGQYLKPGRFGLSAGLQVALASANDGHHSAQYEFRDLGFDAPKKDIGNRSSFKAIADWVDKNL
jgi:hypothetical protein